MPTMTRGAASSKVSPAAEGPEDRATGERGHSACHPLLFLLRSGGDFIKLRLGGTCGP